MASESNSHDAETEEQITKHCFVLSRNAELGDLSNASEVTSRILGSEYSAEFDGEPIVSILRNNETIGFLAHMPIPVPEEEAETNADGNFLWPEGKEQAALHQSHVIVTFVGEDNPTPVESALAVSRLTLVALELFDGIGVYWGNAGVCNSREVFEELCSEMTEENLPVPIWLRFQPIRVSDDSIGIYTLGMQQFGLMDIEVDQCAFEFVDLFEFVTNIALYLMQNGPVIGDGNTVGGSEEERILVRHLPSMIDDDKTVYKIEFES